MKTSNKQYSVPFIKGEQKGIKILKTKNYQQKTTSKISLSLWERVGVRAFTLVELIVVIVILAILSTIAFLSFNSYSSSSRDTVRVTDINSVKKSMELFSIKAGTYPTPDEPKEITYSGGVIWTQGILGDKSTKLISTISKKPTDPLTNVAYTYSLLSNKREFQIAADFENPVSYRDNMKLNNPYIQQVRASSTGTVCYINGNFNGLVAKASTGVINVILAVPSLIVVDTTNTGNLVYDSNFGSGKLQCNGTSSPCSIDFNSNIVFSGSPSTSTDITKMMLAIQDAYTGSNIKTIPVIKNILEASGTTLTDLGNGLIKNSIGTSISTSVAVVSPTYSCTGTLVTFNATITNNTSLTSDTAYQTTVSANKCYYICKPNYSGTNCEITPPTCPTGFIHIPGSENVDGQTKGWCVMKYEASYVDYISGQSTCYEGEPYSNITYCTTSTPRGNGNISSKTNSAVINMVSRDEAQALCNSTYLKDQSGNTISNGKLLTVDLWKKIADDILLQSNNWTSGTIGSGNLSRGHANVGPNTTLKSGDNTLWAAKTPKTDGQYYFSREWTLSNGNTINDFAGNVREWYYDTHNGVVDANWRNYNYISNMSVVGKTIDPDTNTSISGIGALSSVTAGLGQIYNPGATAGSTYASFFGGYWNATAYAGVFASGWGTSSPSSGRSSDLGFRCIAPAN